MVTRFVRVHPVWGVVVGAVVVWAVLWVHGAGQAFLGGVVPAGPIGLTFLWVVSLLFALVCAGAACVGAAMVLAPILRRVLR